MLRQLGVGTHDDPAAMIPDAQQLIKELDEGQGVLILSDIYGATPCNLVGKLLVPGKVEGVAGLNLPMLVRVLTYRNVSLTKLIEKAVSGGREGVVNFTKEACKHHDQAGN
jgi:PTS system ascorbate-specific IIA component